MADYQVGPTGRPGLIDGDLRRRLLAKIGAPLGVVGSGVGISGEESVTDQAMRSLIAGVYEAAGR